MLVLLIACLLWLVFAFGLKLQPRASKGMAAANVLLTAALLLKATPTQMGWLTAMETLPFALLSLPAGVWLDRVRKLPVVVGGELTVALAVSSVRPSEVNAALVMAAT